MTAAPEDVVVVGSLSAVVVNLNGGEEAIGCIRSLLQSDPTPLEIIVVDNGSSDDSLPMLRDMESEGAIRLIALPENVGLARARNVATAVARGNVLAFLDNDITLDPRWAAAAVEAMREFGAACVQCKLVLASDHSRLDSVGYLLGPFAFPSHIVRLGDADSPELTARRLFGVKAAGMVVRKDALEMAGGFDDSYFIYGEETDLCWRIYRSGGAIHYAPESVIYHNAGGTRRFIPDRAADLLYRGGSRNYIRTVVKNSTASALPKDLVGQIAIWTAVAAYCVLRGRTRDGTLIARGILEAVRELPRLVRTRRSSTLPFVPVDRALRRPFTLAYLRKVISAV